ncbi:UNVERIFIED_CONTAM: hypothetical protein FKN15_056234 [Acipenser sinensis]
MMRFTQDADLQPREPLLYVLPTSPGAGEHPLQYNYTFWYSRRTPSRPANTQSYEQNIKHIGSVASPTSPGAGEHPLQYNYTFWYSRRTPSRPANTQSYEQNIKHIGSVASDEANKNGGKWIIRLRKGLASRFWENIILAMLGEQFMVGEEICGVVVSIRFQEDILSIWNKTANDQVTTSRIRDTLRRVLNLPPNTIMEKYTISATVGSSGMAKSRSLFLDPLSDLCIGDLKLQAQPAVKVFLLQFVCTLNFGLGYSVHLECCACYVCPFLLLLAA